MRQIKRHLVFKRHDVCNRASSPTPLAPLGETRVSPRIANFHFDHRHQHRNHQSRHCASQKPPGNHESLDIPTRLPALQSNTAIAINQHLATDRTTNMSATAQAATSNLFHNTVPAEEE